MKKIGTSVKKNTEVVKKETPAMYKIEKEKPVIGMSKLEKEEFVSRIKGMSEEEMNLLVDLIPIDICLERIKREIDKAEVLKNKFKEASNLLD